MPDEVKEGKDMLSRLRAALTPQAILFLAVLLLLASFALSGGNGRTGTQLSLEERTARTLSAMEGAGQVQVVISMREKPQTAALGYGAQISEEVPCGAVAVAQGADDPLVKIQLTQALCALLGLPASAVSVISGGGN